MPRKSLPATSKPDAATVQAIPQASSAVVCDRWEYLTAFSKDVGWGTTRHPYNVTFNDLGTEGWELVSVYQVGGGIYEPTVQAVFKRKVVDL